MPINAIDEFQQAIAAIGMESTDAREQDAAFGALALIEAASRATMEATLKRVRDELFQLQGPLYDSQDRRDSMASLREQCREKAKGAIKQCSLQRDVKSGPQRFARAGNPVRSAAAGRPGASST